MSVRRPLVVLCFAALSAVVAPGARGGLLPAPLSGAFAPEWRSAYQARGSVVEDRPVLILPVELNARTPAFGTFGVWLRELSSLTGRKRSVRSPWDYERDYAVRWRTAWAAADDITLRTDVEWVWLTFHHCRGAARGTAGNTVPEFRVRQRLATPLGTPFWYMRRIRGQCDYVSFQAGLSHPFAPCETLVLTPCAYAEFGSARMMRARYGRRTDGARWRAGVQALNLRLDASWRLTDAVSLTAGVHEFVTLNGPARRAVKAKTSRWARRDLTILSVGLKVTF